jgi:hypothetical protein
VLVAMANLLPYLDDADHGAALVHGLAFVARDTANRPPRFPLTPLGEGTSAAVPAERLAGWYRRFIETRSGDAAERTLVTALSAGGDPATISELMTAAVTDHVFVDVGHTLDFTNKAFEAVEHLGWDSAVAVLPTLTDQTAGASWGEQGSRWRHPHDLAELVRTTEARLPEMLDQGRSRAGAFTDVSGLAWKILEDDPYAVVGSICDAISAGATPEQLGRALALAAALRITRFHTQNDFGDWDSVHHGFTYANALHQCLVRHPSDLLVRGVIHGALRVYLDRFLNVPAARLPSATGAGRPELSELQECWDAQGGVDRAGSIAYRWLRTGGDPRRLVAALGHALLAEDAGFHWFQITEAAVRQFSAWPEDSEEGALILAGAARFLAAHTPTRRELPHVVRTAARLRRGDDLFEEGED